MNNAILLRLHRWLTLVFALPLIVVVVTGLVLSFQPIVQTAAVRPGSLTAERLEALIVRQGREVGVGADRRGERRVAVQRALDVMERLVDVVAGRAQRVRARDGVVAARVIGREAEQAL